MFSTRSCNIVQVILSLSQADLSMTRLLKKKALFESSRLFKKFYVIRQET